MKKIILVISLILTTNISFAMEQQIQNSNQSLKKYFEPVSSKSQISCMKQKVEADVKTERMKKIVDQHVVYDVVYNSSYYDIDSDYGCYTTKIDRTKIIKSHEIDNTLKEIISTANIIKNIISLKQSIEKLQNYLKKLQNVEGGTTKEHEQLISDVLNLNFQQLS